MDNNANEQKILEAREKQRIKCKKYRDTHREEYRLQRREYMKQYMRKVYENNKKMKEIIKMDSIKV